MTRVTAFDNRSGVTTGMATWERPWWWRWTRQATGGWRLESAVGTADGEWLAAHHPDRAIVEVHGRPEPSAREDHP